MVNKVLLIDVEIFKDKTHQNFQHYSQHPVGLLYLVSSVKKVFPAIEFKVFHTATTNEPLKKLESIINSFKPDLIGLRALSLAKDSFEQIANKVRELVPNTIIVGGGPYSSSSYSELLSDKLVDIVVIGEGENTFIDLIGQLKNTDIIPDNVKGTALIIDGKLKINEPRALIQNIDTIPFPDYSQIDFNDYLYVKNFLLQYSSGTAFILCSRGCPYGCFYCHQLFGKKVRRRSPENVVAEMRERIEKYGIYDFVVLDDVFNIPKTEAKKTLSLIIRELPKIRLNFPNGLRADQIDEEMLDLLEEAGTVLIALAVESRTQRLQKLMGKNLNIEKAEKVIEIASKRFITRLFFMVGFPTETYEEAIDTINFAAQFKYAAQPVLSVLRLYNNSVLYNILNPTKEQAAKIAEQEKKVVHLEMFDKTEFYGDFFPIEKVPLKSEDMKELLYYWMRNVLVNSERINMSHQVLVKHLEHKKILEFYRGVYGRSKFEDSDLQKLLKF